MAVFPTRIPILRHTYSQLFHIYPTPCSAFKRGHGMGPATRHLSVTSCRQWATKKTRVSPIIKPSSRTVPLLPPKVYTSFADTLALRSSPILLYQAPSHALYITSCWLLGGFCMTYATINFYTQILDPLKGTPQWVPMLMGGLCVVMVCAGTWAVLGVRIQISRPCSACMLIDLVGSPYHSHHHCHTVFHGPQIAHDSSPT